MRAPEPFPDRGAAGGTASNKFEKLHIKPPRRRHTNAAFSMLFGFSFWEK